MLFMIDYFREYGGMTSAVTLMFEAEERLGVGFSSAFCNVAAAADLEGLAFWRPLRLEFSGAGLEASGFAAWLYLGFLSSGLTISSSILPEGL